MVREFRLLFGQTCQLFQLVMPCPSPQETKASNSQKTLGCVRSQLVVYVFRHLVAFDRLLPASTDRSGQWSESVRYPIHIYLKPCVSILRNPQPYRTTCISSRCSDIATATGGEPSTKIREGANLK
jgi:hypothetical protein